jgi:hypothetical protein
MPRRHSHAQPRRRAARSNDAQKASTIASAQFAAPISPTSAPKVALQRRACSRNARPTQIVRSRASAGASRTMMWLRAFVLGIATPTPIVSLASSARVGTAALANVSNRIAAPMLTALAGCCARQSERSAAPRAIAARHATTPAPAATIVPPIISAAWKTGGANAFPVCPANNEIRARADFEVDTLAVYGNCTFRRPRRETYQPMIRTSRMAKMGPNTTMTSGSGR